MLVLSRRVGEEIIINGQTRVIVLEATMSVVRLGFIAPSSVRVDRKELHDRILSDRGKEAANSHGST